ncbi:MAG: hypothetical protein R3257_06600, partial [bacterium]|nr:hypothetical protein [bacterium]
IRKSKRVVLKLWDNFLCPFLLDFLKIVRAYLPLKVRTRVRDQEQMKEYWKSAEGICAPQSNIHYNLHRLELPCPIPWKYLQKVVTMSWPTSMIRFIETPVGYDYRIFGRLNVLNFKKQEEVPGSYLRYKVTSGFAAGGVQTFLIHQNFVYIDTRVPKGQLFPQRIHNYYTSEHLRNIRKNLFSFQLERGESLL